jgi:hypothetical protein
MNFAPSRWDFAGTAPAAKYTFTPLLGGHLPRKLTARLRRKRPSGTALALFILAADVALASLAWVAVDFVLQ